MPTSNNPRLKQANKDHAMKAQLKAVELGNVVGSLVKYLKEYHFEPVLADPQAPERRKVDAQAEIDMLSAFQAEVNEVLREVRNAQAKAGGIHNISDIASAQSRLLRQTRFTPNTLASSAFSQTKHKLQHLQNLRRDQSTTSGTLSGSKRKAASTPPDITHGSSTVAMSRSKQTASTITALDPSSTVAMSESKQTASSTVLNPSSTESTHARPPLEIDYPKPKRQGDFYEKMEVIEILAAESNARRRGRILKDMLHHTLLPPQCTYESIRQALKRYLRKIPINPEWGGGRPAKIPASVLLAESKKLMEQSGRALTEEDLKNLAEKVTKERADREGNATVDTSISRKTLRRNQVALMALENDTRFAGNTAKKTGTPCGAKDLEDLETGPTSTGRMEEDFDMPGWTL